METKRHIEFMIKYMEESENSGQLLGLLDMLATIIVDSDTETLSGATYSREITINDLTIKVLHNPYKQARSE